MSVKRRIMAHMVAFYPDYGKSLEVARALIEGGASIVEVQFPFSDPSADGPVIQRACKVALERGFSVEWGLKLLKRVKELGDDIPVFLMSYANIVFTRGIKDFLKQLASIGVSGIIVPDLPPDYDEGLYETGREIGIDVIPVATVTVKPHRLEEILAVKPRYLYVALRKGITGERTYIDKRTVAFLDNIRGRDIKILGGFGISERKQVDVLMPHVYAAVVGSAFVREIQRNGENKNPYRSVLNKIRELVGE